MFQLLFIYLAFKNGNIAKAKGLNPVLYFFATTSAILFCMVTGGAFVALTFCSHTTDFNALTSFDQKQRLAASHQLQQALTGDPIHFITIMLFAVGGYLLAKFMLEQEADMKQPELIG